VFFRADGLLGGESGTKKNRQNNVHSNQRGFEQADSVAGELKIRSTVILW